MITKISVLSWTSKSLRLLKRTRPEEKANEPPAKKANGSTVFETDINNIYQAFLTHLSKKLMKRRAEGKEDRDYKLTWWKDDVTRTVHKYAKGNRITAPSTIRIFTYNLSDKNRNHLKLHYPGLLTQRNAFYDNVLRPMYVQYIVGEDRSPSFRMASGRLQFPDGFERDLKAALRRIMQGHE